MRLWKKKAFAVQSFAGEKTALSGFSVFKIISV